MKFAYAIIHRKIKPVPSVKGWYWACSKCGTPINAVGRHLVWACSCNSIEAKKDHCEKSEKRYKKFRE